MTDQQEDEIHCSPFERQLFDAINEMRRDSSGVISALEFKLESFIEDSNKMKITPTSYVMTQEGKGAVLEAIEYLQQRQSVGQVSEQLIWSDEAAALCALHTAKGAENPDLVGLIPNTEHEKFKTLFSEEFGGEEKVGGHAECHEYGSSDPFEVLLTLIIDDGNASRSNRKQIFGKWDYIGLSSREVPSFNRMTSILFVIAEDTVQREMNAAVSVAEELLGIADVDWSKKKVAVAYGDNQEIIVRFTLIFKDGSERMLTHKMAS